MVSETTVSRYLSRLRERNPDPDVVRRWVAFLRNHKAAIAGMDFFTVPPHIRANSSRDRLSSHTCWLRLKTLMRDL